MLRTLFLSFSLLVTLVAASGCSDAAYDDGACPPYDHVGRVTDINGTAVAVSVMQGSRAGTYAVLDTEGADFYTYAGSLDECFDQPRDMLTAGQEVAFQVDAWQESEPPRAGVDAIVVLG